MLKVLFRLLPAALLLVLSLATRAQAPAAQQTPQPETQQPSGGKSSLPVLKVSTRLVVVDVVATDKKGVPITDLKAEDFSLQEEEHKENIRVFSFQAPVLETSQPAAAEPRLPPNRFTNIPLKKPTGPLHVILIDGLNTGARDLSYSKEQMLKVLEKLPSGSPVAVYALGTRLRLLQDFTTDPALLKQAVHNMKSKSAPGFEGGPGQKSGYLSPEVAGAMNEMGLGAMLDQIKAFQQDNAVGQTNIRVDLTLQALRMIARNVSGYSGRKNLIWISEAFPLYMVADNPLYARQLPSTDRNMFNLMTSYEPEMKRTADILSNAHVAVYPVDARAVSSNDVYSNLSNTDSNGNYLGRSARGTVREGVSQTGAEISRSSGEAIDAHGAMNALADETGGRAFYNTNNLDGAIRQGMADGATYYTLGYYPENKNWDGKFRRVAVSVNRPGVKLHYRAGYFAVDPTGYAKLDDRQRAQEFGQALGLTSPISTALLFQAAVIPPSGTDNKVHIDFAVDPHGLDFEPTDDGVQHASVDCAVAVFNTKGETVRVQGNTNLANLPPEPFKLVMQKFFACGQTLELNPGDYVLRLGVRDGHTGVIGTTNARLTVPAPSAATVTGAADDKKP